MPFSCGVLVAPAADPRGELSHPAPGHTVAWYVDSSVAVKHSVNMEGGPSDIMLRRGMGGLQPAAMVPAVDPACATSDYLTATTLGNAHAENLSSNTPTATSANLTDDTELNYTENALAHRGVLRGGNRWVGWNCTADLVRLWAQLDNYNLWLRRSHGRPFRDAGALFDGRRDGVPGRGVCVRVADRDPPRRPAILRGLEPGQHGDRPCGSSAPTPAQTVVVP